MTLAIDRKTGAVVGQVIRREPAPQMLYTPETEWITVLERGGRYTTYLYPSASVRLERMEDN